MSKSDIAKSIHQRLLNVRDKTGEDFSSILSRYGMERILYRIMASNHANSFVLKGAMLFQLWHNVPGRPTRDVDLLGYGNLDHVHLKQIFTDEFLEDQTKQTQWKGFLNRSKLSDFEFTLPEVGKHISERIWPIMQKCKEL